MSSMEDYVRRLKKEVKELDKKLTGARHALDHAVKDMGENAPAPEVTTARRSDPAPDDRPYRHMGNQEAVLQYLMGITEPKTTPEIGRALKDGGLPSEAKKLNSAVFSALKRLRNSGHVTSSGKRRATRWEAVSKPETPASPKGETGA